MECCKNLEENMGIINNHASHVQGIKPEDVVKNAAKAEKKLEASEESNPFANGKGNDPHARGAESSYDFIKNNR